MQFTVEINHITDLKTSWTYFVEIIRYEDVLRQDLRRKYFLLLSWRQAGRTDGPVVLLLPYNKILLSTLYYYMYSFL